jgi:hypothetical protein
MKKFELQVRQPRWYTGDQWERVSENILFLLTKRCEFNATDEAQCGWELGSFLQDAQVRWLALQALGNTLPSTLDKVKKLELVGNGDCPNCGSNDRTALTGGYEPASMDGESGGFKVLGYRCNVCDEEVTV